MDKKTKVRTTKRSQEEIKEREEKRRRFMIVLMIIISAGTFIIADLYYGITKPPTDQEIQNNPIDVSFRMNFMTKDVIFVIKNFTGEYYLLPTPNQRFDWQTLLTIKNTSSKGIEKIEVDFIEGKGVAFKFKINKTENLSEEEILDNIYETFKYSINIEDKGKILGIYTGYIQGLPYIEENKVNIFALPSIKGDYVIGSLYSRNDSSVKIGIQSDIIEDCSNVSAKVLNITSINVKGEIYDLNFVDQIKRKFNISLDDLRVENPKVVNISNESLIIKKVVKLNPKIEKDDKNNTIMKFRNFVIILNISKNETINEGKILNFEYNSSKKEIEEILANVTYNILPGKISFSVRYEDWNDKIYEYIKKNLENLKIESKGKVKVRKVCVAEKKLLAIINNENFDAILNLGTKEGDVISVSIAYYSMTGAGESRLIPYIAIEKNK